ncbi:transcriptional regulator [Stygiolobus caldivivus]|uniref:Transcriptional regulator n=2 Tax=Stygiolobus caldivivus TaxID=2824673 RepID=A0A8D5U6T3_9CREN|nr:transcriptional regulator [Stygiolobus caldivivus]
MWRLGKVYLTLSVIVNMQLDLRQSTKKVYYYIMQNRNGVTLKQIQEDLGFSSTSAVRYHINKLKSAGLIQETYEGKYVIKKVVLDDDYILLFNYILPKSVFFASFFLTSFALLLYLWRLDSVGMEVFSLIVVFIAGIVFVFDTVKRYTKFMSEVRGKISNEGDDD